MATTATHRFDQYETTKMLGSQRHPYKLMACETSLNMPFSATSSKSPWKINGWKITFPFWGPGATLGSVTAWVHENLHINEITHLNWPLLEAAATLWNAEKHRNFVYDLEKVSPVNFSYCGYLCSTSVGVISSHFYRFKLRILFAPPSFFQVTSWFPKWRSLKLQKWSLMGPNEVATWRTYHPELPNTKQLPVASWLVGRPFRGMGMPIGASLGWACGLLIRAILTFGDTPGGFQLHFIHLTASLLLKMGLQLPTRKKNRLPTLPFFRGELLSCCFVGRFKLV